MKSWIETVRLLLSEVRRIIFLMGLIFVVIFAGLSLAYIQGESGVTSPDFTRVITGGNGLMAYCWVMLLAIWLGLEAFYWGSRIRGWWINRSDIKRDMMLDWDKLKRLTAKITGNTER